MADVYTLGIWTVKPGREEEFVSLWSSLADRTLADFPHASGTLLRDRDRPGRYVSFGPWRSVEEIAAWRESPAFAETVARMRDVLEAFEPGTFDLERRAGRGA